MAASKCYSLTILRPSAQSYVDNCERWVGIFARSETESVFSINRASVRHFGDQKMRFFNGQETLHP